MKLKTVILVSELINSHENLLIAIDTFELQQL